ncbi:tetratricopeptide repeat protein [Faecalicatena sp. AGMB00832]|uniref:Tetratricopeptide repeat protein n=1 Tax=Faecalicatena faecalis TaxID=2726362 RepID=A0ABS6D0X2_9FIRM|nr:MULTISPECIES: tetratricopeptide repeat protein [Faecalicatena]MBU3875131.1 tetratricopeptide repeat protein [Faecalicatena faecalis]MCI6467760.1 tetratricopeptide repeat protein [Faecalicatena sp.]MDY5619598.1 tetratricopeptide repeat protein [Lachnospiraceae bacterium]
MKKGVLCILLVACLTAGCQKKVNYIEQGTQQMEEQKYEDAVSSFQQSLEKKEDAQEAYRGLGMAYYEQKDYKAAREAFQNVIANDGEESAVLYNFIGVCSMQLDDMEGALDAFQKGIALAEKADSSESGTQKEGGNKDGAADLSKTIQEMKFNEIVCYEQLHDWQSAKEKAEAYIAKYPDDQAAQKEVEFLKTR